MSVVTALSKEDVLKENLFLKGRTDLRDHEVPAEKLKKCNLEMFIKRQNLN